MRTDVLPMSGSQLRGLGYGLRLRNSHVADPMPVGGGKTLRKYKVQKATPKKNKVQSTKNHAEHRPMCISKGKLRKYTKTKTSDEIYIINKKDPLK